jgi:hypothetical protein
MRKFWLIVVFVSLFFLLTACKPDEVTITEIPDFSTFIEVVVEPTLMDTIYMIEEIELTSENSIYIVVDEDVYKGTFIGVEDGDTVFSINAEIGFYDWMEALEDDLIRCYYK